MQMGYYFIDNILVLSITNSHIYLLILTSFNFIPKTNKSLPNCPKLHQQVNALLKHPKPPLPTHNHPNNLCHIILSIFPIQKIHEIR